MAVTADLRAGAMVLVVLVVLVSSTCAKGPETDAGIFFPTWSADGPVPAGIVQGTLAERDGCVFLVRDGRETLIVWNEGHAFADGSLLGPSGEPIANIGETLHGGGGYYGRVHAEDVSGDSIPDRCVPDNVDGFALIYGVEAGPFEGV